MQYVIQHSLPYILASTCWQWGSSSDADTCRQWGSSSDAVSMEVDPVGTTSGDDLFVLLQLVENMRPLNASAAEAVLVEGSVPFNPQLRRKLSYLTCLFWQKPAACLATHS